MSVRPALAEKIFGTLLARRGQLRSGPGAGAIRIIGSRYSPRRWPAHIRRAFPHTAHVGRPRGRRGRGRAAGEHGRRRTGDAGGHHAHTHAAPALPRRVRGGARAHLPAGAGLHLRPGRRRQRTRRPRRRGLRSLRGPAHRVPRRGRDRRSGRRELEDRELHRVPERHLRRGPHGEGGGPGDAARRAAERAHARWWACAPSAAFTVLTLATAARSRRGR